MMDVLRDLLLNPSPWAVLIVSLVKATLVLSIAQLVVAARPGLSASMRHLILTAALSSFVIIPLIAFAAPRWTVEVRVETAAVSASAPRSTSERADRAPESNMVDPAPSPSAAAPARAAFQGPSPLQAVVGIWLAVSLLLAGRLLRSSARVKGIVNAATQPSARTVELFEEVRWRLAIESDVRVLQSEQIAVPMVWGIRNGTLLLPTAAETWSDEDLRGTLIHELAHLQRLDYFSLTLINLVSVLLWFHPQIWSARSRALAEGERACDDLVVRAGELPSGYASHLLQVARLMPRRDPHAALLAMSRPSQLEGRMYAILSTSVNRAGVGRKLLMAVVTLFCAAVVPLSMLQAAGSSMVAPTEGVNQAARRVSTPTQWFELTQSDGVTMSSNVSDPADGVYSCDDFNATWSSLESVTGEERISVAGRRLSVSAHQTGGIRFRRSRTGAFSVLACKAAAGSTLQEASRRLSQISVEERGGVVAVKAPDEELWLVHLIVDVPDGASVEARTQNGPLWFDGVDATIDAAVTNGPLTLLNSRGAIRARTTNGPMSLTRMSGDIDAIVENGPLSISLDGPGWKGGELRASVGNGPLSLLLPERYGAGVLLNMTGQGPFACSLPECRALEPPRRHRGPWQPRALQLGDGPDRVFIETANGPVAIAHRD